MAASAFRATGCAFRRAAGCALKYVPEGWKRTFTLTYEVCRRVAADCVCSRPIYFRRMGRASRRRAARRSASSRGSANQPAPQSSSSVKPSTSRVPILDQRRGFPISCCWSSGLVFALCIDFWSDWSTLVLWSVREASFCPFRVVPLRLRRLYWREACRLDGCIGASEGSTVAWFRFRLRLFDGCIGGMRQFRPHATVSSAPFSRHATVSSAFKRPVRPPIRRSRPPGGLFQRPAGPGSAALCDGRAGKLPRQWKNIQCLSDPLRVAPGPASGTSEFK